MKTRIKLLAIILAFAMVCTAVPTFAIGYPAMRNGVRVYGYRTVSYKQLRTHDTGTDFVWLLQLDKKTFFNNDIRRNCSINNKIKFN